MHFNFLNCSKKHLLTKLKNIKKKKENNKMQQDSTNSKFLQNPENSEAADPN